METPWSATEAAKSLRDEAGTFTDPRQMYAGQSLADYIESTVLPERSLPPMLHRVVFAEMALAYAAGWEEASNERPKELVRALFKVGLSV